MRLTWDDFFMRQAIEFSKRATCSRLKVGCIITKDELQLAEGYNGSISGHPHCEDVGCLTNEEGRCIRTIHAEKNAILNAMKKGVSVVGGTAYVTHECCENCTKELNQAGIRRVVYLKEYKNKYNKFFYEPMKVEKFQGKLREEYIKELERRGITPSFYFDVKSASMG